MPPSMTPSIPGVDGMTEEEIAAFLESLDECTPTIPDGLTNHYLKQSGIKEPDVRITRLISLAAQKFVTQIAQDARQCAQQRSEMKAREKSERGYGARGQARGADDGGCVGGAGGVRRGRTEAAVLPGGAPDPATEPPAKAKKRATRGRSDRPFPASPATCKKKKSGPPLSTRRGVPDHHASSDAITRKT